MVDKQMQQNPRWQIGGLESKLKLIADTVADDSSMSGILLFRIYCRYQKLLDPLFRCLFSVCDTYLYPILGGST